MATVRLTSQLQALAGGVRDHDVAATDVRAALIEIEARHPPIAGWILDERRAVRRHINVFVNGDRCGPDTPLGPADRVVVLPAITGGS